MPHKPQTIKQTRVTLATTNPLQRTPENKSSRLQDDQNLCKISQQYSPTRQHHQTPAASYQVKPQETYSKRYEPRTSIPMRDISRPKT
eukprot:12333638-Ditylum_brightwellii.AAC.1